MKTNRFARIPFALCLLWVSGCLQVEVSQVGRQMRIAPELAPNLSFLQSTYSFAVLSTIPTESAILRDGVVQTCTISPSLPAGMSWDSLNCAFSGIAGSAPQSQSYTVTASNAQGSSTASFVIEFYQVPPAIAYSQASYTFPILSAGTTGAITNTGGSISGCSVSPALSAGLSIHATNCTISGTPAAPQSSISYTVTATNSAGASTPVVVQIAAANVAPQITYSQSSYTFTLASASTTGTPTNTGGIISSCAVSPALPAGMSVGATSCAITGTPSSPLSSTNYTVTATNAVGTSQATLQLEVLNIAPMIAFSQGSYSASLNAAFSTSAPTNSGGAIVSCAVSPTPPAGLSINSANCTISGTPTSVTSSATYTVTATNAIGSHSVSVVLQVLNVAPQITFASSSYSFNLMSSYNTGNPSNAGGAITSCSVSPALSAGLSISSTTCAISGTPSALTSPATRTYTVTPTNGIGSGTSVNVDITVNNIVPALSYSASSYGMTLFSAGSTTVPTNSGGAITSCSVSPSLPAGLNISQTTCEISGTPSAPSSSTEYVITPQNAVGAGSNVSVYIQVANIAPQITYSASVYAFDLQSAADTGAPTNSGGAITGCSVSPALPTGLSLNTSTCRITGTPTAVSAASTYTITPSNSIGSGSAVTLSIQVRNVAPSLSYSPSSFTYTVNSAVSTVTPSNAGGVATSCTSTPTLPAGLTLTANCRFNGTPTAPQSATDYLIVGSNAIGSDSERKITIAINNIAPVIAYSGGPYVYRKGTAITSRTPTNTGGPGITSCASSPALPAGLSLSSACVLSGTPTVTASSASYTITATNSAGTGSTTINITVNDALPIIAYSDASYSALVATFLDSDVPVSSGGTITSCAITAGSLPNGVSINTSNCRISGTVTEVEAGTFNFTVTPSSSGGAGTGVDLCIAIGDGKNFGLCGAMME